MKEINVLRLKKRNWLKQKKNRSLSNLEVKIRRACNVCGVFSKEKR